MSTNNQKILVTGATGQLGALVIDRLLASVPAANIIATGRRVEALKTLGDRGVEIRTADFAKPETLERAFAGADRMLLVSTSEMGQRASQHRNAIAAAKRAGIKLIVYTSILRADTSDLILAEEHLDTENVLKASGIPYVILRNGWYLENFASAVQQANIHGAFATAASDGKFSAAARRDYADAAAAVLTSANVDSGTVYELAGDSSFTMSELAAAVAKNSSKDVRVNNLAQEDYHALLVGFGLPDAAATIYSQSDAAAANGALFDNSRQLSKLIGRPTTPLSGWLATAV